MQFHQTSYDLDLTKSLCSCPVLAVVPSPIFLLKFVLIVREFFVDMPNMGQ